MSVKRPLLFAAAMLAAMCSFAQTKSDVFKPDVEVTWLGLDFSSTKLIGDREKFGSESDVRRLLEAWNQLILTEFEKFDIAKAIKRSKVERSIDVTNEHNAEVDVLSMFTDDEKAHLHLNPNDVEELVGRYDFKGKTGLGLMFVVESFNRFAEEGSIYVTFVNMGSKEVLFTERLVGEPKGFGMRNYWAGCIYQVINKIGKKEFEMWRKKYFRP
jgi:hypothetical protein